jgi:hypothetical protein
VRFRRILEKNLIVADDDENHTGRAGLKEEIFAERVSMEVGQRWKRRLRKSRREGQREQEDEQPVLRPRIAHLVFIVFTMQNTKLRDLLQWKCSASDIGR